jgi:hypothetical protein
MDIVYTALQRRLTSDPIPPGEVAEVIDALWAHSAPEDGLEHASGRAGADRIDLMLYLLGPDPSRPAGPGAAHRAAALLTRCHQASPVLRRHYLAPAPPTLTTATNSGHPAS